MLGGHTFIARSVADGIARKLGNALVAPVLPFSPAVVDAGGLDDDEALIASDTGSVAKGVQDEASTDSSRLASRTTSRNL